MILKEEFLLSTKGYWAVLFLRVSCLLPLFDKYFLMYSYLIKPDILLKRPNVKLLIKKIFLIVSNSIFLWDINTDQISIFN